MPAQPRNGLVRRREAVLADAGQTIVLVKQNLAATPALAHRAYSLNNGHIVHESSPDEFKSQPEILPRHLGV